MNAFDEKEQWMRSYWLGVLSEEQTESFEIEWFGSDEDAELLEIARADLIDDYLAKNLTADELNQFEKHFLLNNLEDIALAKSSLQISNETFARSGSGNFFKEFFGNIRGFFGVPQIAAAVLLVGCFGLFLKYYNNGSVPEIAKNVEPANDSVNVNPVKNPPIQETNAVTETNEEPKDVSANDSRNANVKTNKTAETNKAVNADKRPVNDGEAVRNRKVVFLMAFRGAVKTIDLENARDDLTLKLAMPGIDKAYQDYEMRIYDSENKLVVRQSLGKGLSSKKSGETITLPTLKGKVFEKNKTYKTSLVGIDEKNQANELSSYSDFKIN
ncbi:MAG: hypothetical protein LUM44_19420 [Pyrinomonadaceae bacterium]|nr:hypothetical protein [Pyrinomonadaceae bacterium]